MANMSYCQFENTVDDMQQCFDTLAEAVENGLSYDQFIERVGSDYEKRAVNKMVDLLLNMQEAFDQLNDNQGLSEAELEEIDE
jgi:hypothetical protein